MIAVHLNKDDQATLEKYNNNYNNNNHNNNIKNNNININFENSQNFQEYSN